jgi:hypothetical protein
MCTRRGAGGRKGFETDGSETEILREKELKRKFVKGGVLK